jgi:DHA1 family tetracycline resistance protein-like MFS transporter
LQQKTTTHGDDENALLRKLDMLWFLSSIAVWIATFYIAILGYELGLSDFEIGIVATAYAVSLLLSNYLFGALSDAFGAKPFLIVGFLFSSALFMVHIFAFNYMSLFYVRLITGVALGTYPGALFALAHNTKARMGQFSSFGSLGSFVGLVGAGFLSEAYGVKSLFILGAIVFLAAFVVSFQINREPTASRAISLKPAVTIKENLSTYASLLTRHTGANAVWTFWSLYLLSLGANNLYVGLINASNSLAQFLTMRYLTDRFGSRREFDLGLLLSGGLFISLAFANDFWQTWVPYALLGCVWSFIFVGAVRSLADTSTRTGEALGAFNSTLNLSTLLGPILATAVIIFGDYRTMMYAAAILCFSSYMISMKLRPLDKAPAISDRAALR